MTTINHGIVAPILADGSSMIQSVSLTTEQYIRMEQDRIVLNASERSRKTLKAANLAVRFFTVLSLLGVAVLLVAGGINEFAAIAITIPLLFAVDIFNAIEEKVTAKHNERSKTLQMFNAVTALASGHFYSKTHTEKLDYYRTLLVTGKVVFSKETSHRLVLIGDNAEQKALAYLAG